MDDRQFFQVLTEINEKLSDLKTGVTLLNQKLIDHTENDATNFAAIDHRLGDMDDKVSIMVVEMAENRGRDAALRNSTRKIGAAWGGWGGGITGFLAALGAIIGGCTK